MDSTTNIDRDIGVYVHFPYCRRLCPYCDFAVKIAREIPHEPYANLVIDELIARSQLFPGRSLNTIYFGGGTPGMWEARSIGRVVETILRLFPGDPVEVTCEINPEDAKRENLSALRSAGITRLSIGVQSLSPRVLTLLGRNHSPAQALFVLETARAIGFHSVSCDLIYAVPGETAEELAASIRDLISLRPEHLSAYSLTVEPRTRFGTLTRRGAFSPPDLDMQATSYWLCHEQLSRAGYHHYEVSNYALPGWEAIHNRRYWSGGEVLGVGVSAHSLRHLPSGEWERFASPRELKKWQSGVIGLASHLGLAEASRALPATDPLVSTRELLHSEDRRFERLFLSLRTSNGVPRSDFSAAQIAQIGDMEARGLLVTTPDRVYSTPAGMLLADEICLRLAEPRGTAGVAPERLATLAP